jgi:chromate transporter
VPESHLITSPEKAARGSAIEVGAAFLKLGLTSFGGPVAHIGYFHREFVERRRWLSEQHFGQLLALCQFLPGPASSELGFSIGLLRAGWPGALAAFLGFTLPSALLLFAFALFSSHLGGVWGMSLLHGLKLVAVAVVAHGLLNMARTLTPDLPRLALAAAVTVLMLVSNQPWMQLFVIALGAACGPWLCRTVHAKGGDVFDLRYGKRTGNVLLTTFALLLAGSFVVMSSPLLQAAAAFYRTGALVFGGGHVVLPLLKQAVVAPGWLDNNTFLAGYGAAQAVPGPMFTLSAFLGERLHGGTGGALGAFVALIAIFAPGMLLTAGTLPYCRALGTRDGAARMLAGINAAVVGLLGAAFYNPVWQSAIRDVFDIAVAGIGFLMLAIGRWPPLTVVGWCVAACLLRVWI